ncbi:MAG: MFS transporter [Anaerolineae bacterium]|nr:MAG: MFS transporter [Anaerolineae bacterium]
MLNKITADFRALRRFPRQFWILMGASFIDRLGGALLFPFFALYVSERFDVGMTVVGGLFAIFAIASQVGGFIGGALADRFGRKSLVLFGLVVSALSSVVMGYVDSLAVFYVVAGIVGVLADMAGPAQQAMVADLLPEEQRAEGYGIWRVLSNLAVMIGPLIGGFMAARSYLFLFWGDATTSVITAAILFVALHETKPAAAPGHEHEKFSQTLAGYAVVLRDMAFVGFLAASIFLNIVYIQMNSSLPVFLRDARGAPPHFYGIILSMNAGMVVLMQFWLTRRLKGIAPLLLMALGGVFYLFGFGLYAFVDGLALFALAMAIITIGEMIVVPTAQTLAAKLAPEAMRGRYMAVFALAWTIPFAAGPYLAGLVLDNRDPNSLWLWGALFCAVAITGYVLLHNAARARVAEPEAEAAPAG